MNTNSERHLVQLYVEAKIGCPSSADLVNCVGAFEAFQIDHADFAALNTALNNDAEAMLRKGIQTITQALAGLDAGRESWALIKLYYATYFFLREGLARDGNAFLRCKNIYTLDIKHGESPVKRTGKAYRGDHLSTIKLFSDRFLGRDPLLSQNIDDVAAYDWLRDKREWINYRRRDFFDGSGTPGFSEAEMSYPDQVNLYCNDSIPIFCFDPDFAALALPLKRAQFSIAAVEEGPTILADCIEKIKKSGGKTKSCRAFLSCF